MNILDTIIEYKKSEVKNRKAEISVAELQKSEFFRRKILSMKKALFDESKTGIIAEFKRRSPSKGVINENADIGKVVSAYARNGASGLSVLTDSTFFGGCAQDLETARLNQVPILRKDFIIDEYQVTETRAMGADVILLIAACLDPAEVKNLAGLARSMQLEVLLEIHNEIELDHICDEIDLVGVNNRDLKTFEVDIDRSIALAKRIPADKIKITESGISSIENIFRFRENGFKGFLIGEYFMKQPDPATAFAEFIKQLKAKAT